MRINIYEFITSDSLQEFNLILNDYANNGYVTDSEVKITVLGKGRDEHCLFSVLLKYNH